MKTLLLVTALVVNAFDGETSIKRYAVEHPTMETCGKSAQVTVEVAKQLDGFIILELSCVVRDVREH